MSMVGEATLMGTSLEVGAITVGWRLSIRRADRKSDPRFFRLNTKDVTAADVAEFVPNWRRLTWETVAESNFSHSTSRARDENYEVTISRSRSSELAHVEVRRAFVAFMNLGTQEVS